MVAARPALPSMSKRPITPVPQRGTTDSRAPARLELSSGSKELQRELLSLKQDEIPAGWEEAAAAERRLAGLGPVNLRAEWRKLVAYSEGARITIWRWRGWVLKARRADGADLPLVTRGLPLPAIFCVRIGCDRVSRS